MSLDPLSQRPSFPLYIPCSQMSASLTCMCSCHFRNGKYRKTSATAIKNLLRNDFIHRARTPYSPSIRLCYSAAWWQMILPVAIATCAPEEKRNSISIEPHATCSVLQQTNQTQRHSKRTAKNWWNFKHSPSALQQQQPPPRAATHTIAHIFARNVDKQQNENWKKLDNA